MRRHVSDDDEVCRFWAAWTLTLHKDGAGLRSLTHWLGRGDRFGETALQLSLRAMTPDDSRESIRVLAKDPESQRSAVVAIGVLGDPTTVPWTIKAMQSPQTARLAGEAFSMITGVDLARKGLDRVGPEESDAEDVQEPSDKSIRPDYDSHLPWPQAAVIDEWWQSHQGQFGPESSWLVYPQRRCRPAGPSCRQAT